jgi:hypothetical protein
MLATGLALPIGFSATDVPSGADNPLLRLMARLALGVGLPFFVISAHAPLLQTWFSQTRHPAARDPYFLYAASNFGSLAALLGYPLIVERLLPVSRQAEAWSWGYGAMIALAAACALVLWLCPKRSQPASGGAGEFLIDEGDAGRVTMARRAKWLLLSFVPSSHMLGVTTHLTTELAPIPLLWVLPLALYLLTFILVFARRPLLPRGLILRAATLLVVPTAAIVAMGRDLQDVLLAFPLHLCAFFFVAMGCHGALADDRPSAGRLTEFYLLMSVGGVLGGVFNALVAPVAFDRLLEYPLILVLAALVLPRVERAGSTRRIGRDVLIPLLAVAGLVLVAKGPLAALGERVAQPVIVAAPIALGWVMWSRRLRLGVLFAALLATLAWWAGPEADPTVYRGRNFYGVKRVKQTAEATTLVHCQTVHGMESREPHRRGEPQTYYHREGPVGDLFAVYHGKPASPKVAVIGLGIGTMAAYGQAGMEFDLYEIDPEIARLAEDGRFFHFLADCPAPYSIILGDGRLTLAAAPKRGYGAIFLDAFSSDAIPTHLLTREALALYLDRLADGGFLAFHVSNKYVELAPILAAHAAELGLAGYVRNDVVSKDETQRTGRYTSCWVVLARCAADLGPLPDDSRWTALHAPAGTPVWTDQYTDVLRMLRRPAWLGQKAG